ncbi:MAG: hypothetical protein DRQ54_11155 [Gammaproteobacteria bacterium]|nr:MAG: hypothetical protein DRQ54_11155 [Gammaproteobacteria bacterium]
MPGRVLHILSQRPSRTGSGVTLEAMVRQAARAGWHQAAVVGVPAHETAPRVGTLAASAIHAVGFAAEPGGAGDLDFPVPGMSDVMPYVSTIWSTMTDDQLARYRTVWRQHLARVIADFVPDILHTHHIWLVSSLLKDVAPDIPIVTTCHSTGLRQMGLTPGLADEVRRGCARNDHFCVLRDDHGTLLRESLQVDAARITVIGAGYRPDIFHRDGAVTANAENLLYTGKYSHAKGLPWLLDAFLRLTVTHPGLRLHIAGSGAGNEAEALRHRMESLAPAIVLHGQLSQPQLADLMRRCAVCVLPSFYEGVPLVLVEAAACGCRLVATALPGVVDRIQPHVADRLELVSLPRLRGSDQPVAADLPRFTDDLTDALAAAIDQAAAAGPQPSAPLTPFSWESVFGRVQGVWQDLLT